MIGSLSGRRVTVGARSTAISSRAGLPRLTSRGVAQVMRMRFAASFAPLSAVRSPASSFSGSGSGVFVLTASFSGTVIPAARAAGKASTAGAASRVTGSTEAVTCTWVAAPSAVSDSLPA